MTATWKTNRLLPALLLLSCLLLGPPATAAAGDRAPAPLGPGDIGVIATSGPGGTMRILWNPPADGWPAGGYRVERRAGGRTVTVAEGLFPGADQEALARLDEASREGLVRAGEELRRGQGGNEAGLGIGVLFLRALRSFDFARALGIACVDPAPPEGSFRYRVVAVDGAGKTIAEGRTVRVRRGWEAPPPPAPADLAVSASPEGMTLRWRNRLPAEEGQPPAVLFLVLRRADGAPEPVQVGEGPALLSGTTEGTILDGNPPPGTTVRYTVVPVDPFGRRGPESEPVEAWSPDWKALAPPATITATAAPGAVKIAWQAEANPHRKGWIVARGLGAHGPFQPLVPDPVPEPSWRDDGGTPGTVYWYAVRAVGERGLTGDWAVARPVRFQRAAPLPAPAELSAEVGRGRVSLRWRQGDRAGVAGWIVERAAGTDGEFLPLHRGLVAAPRYVDRFPPDHGGLYRYRVIAVGPGDDRSDPSEEVAVPLPDTRPPAPPRIVRADGVGGGVHLAWEPGARDRSLAGWMVLRSPVPDALGAVITGEKPLPRETTEYADTTAEAGRRFYYRVVAVDAAGNRSVPAGPVAVVATPLPLPRPPRPEVTIESSPRRHAVLRFSAPDRPDVRWAVQRRAGDGPWERIAGPLPADATTFRDERPPAAGTPVAWRLVAIGTNGRPGPAGPEATPAD